MAHKQLPLPGGELVKKSNAIARAQWKPESIWEPRIVALVASKVRDDDEDFFTYRIPVAELTGVSDENLRGNQYEEIKKSILHLGKASIRIQGVKPKNFMSYPIFSACGYEDGYLVSRFDPDLKPHFLNLKAQFTAYNLFDYLSLPSSYSQHLFEILKSWSNLPEVVISVAELHETLNTPPSFRKDFKALRTRVLEKAHKDINGLTTLEFEWEAIKTGREVSAIRFLFAPRRKAVAEADNQKAKRKKQSKANNKAAILAIQCSQAKQGECGKQDNKLSVCKVCMTLELCEEMRRKATKV